VQAWYFLEIDKMSRKLIQDPWIKTQQAYLLREKLVNERGYTMAEMPGVTAAVFAYINADMGATITRMRQQITFKNTSLSTLKRAVGWLLDNRLIYQSMGKDKRTRILIAAEV